MDSVRSFGRIWLLLTVAILAYAYVDLRLHPSLLEEHTFTMEPDLSRIGQLWHWGGRLLKERALALLVCNAVILAGLVTLIIRWIIGSTVRDAESEADVERTSLVPSRRTSVPPSQ